jgi:hypothetical protein
MKKETKNLIVARMSGLLSSRNPFIATECARIILACEGIFPEGAYNGLTQQQGANPRATASITLARNHVAKTFQEMREVRKKQNARCYKRRILKKQGYSIEDINKAIASLEANEAKESVNNNIPELNDLPGQEPENELLANMMEALGR